MKLIKPLVSYFFSLIGIFFIGRVVLFSLYFERFANDDVNYWLSFLYGLKMDIIVVCASLIFPLILLTLFPKQLKALVNQLLKIYFLFVILLFVYIENATLPFFAEYDVRPNFLFVEYLDYPQEVFSMIASAYKLELLIAFLMLSGISYIFLRNKHWTDFSAVFDVHYAKRIALFIPLAFLLVLGIRSSFGHRPANISDAMYSSNRVLNEITKNSLYSIAYAMYRDKKYGHSRLNAYGEMPINDAMKIVSKALNIPLSLQTSSPFSRIEQTHFSQKKPKNLVIFLQESLGAQFVAATGGQKGLTPNFNRLSKEGILFSNLFSNGTRSIRGIAGSVAGNFAVPGKGIVKRNKSQSNFFTIASLLKPFGYHSLFIYGGESHFDDMKAWFLGNGFDKVIDQSDFINPEYTGTWGVSDGDMVMRAHQEFTQLSKKNQPFVAVMFSTSNHSPFDFPEGKIDLLKGIPEKSDLNAIKYADYAIGEFIKAAKKEAYYQDTVFVVVADHNIRVRGSDMLPVKLYHIPAMILGGGINAQNNTRLSTQPDVLATALDLTGQDLKYPILGHSIFSDQKKDLAFMQFNDTFALRIANKVAVLRPEKEALTFSYEDQKMIPIEHDKELEQKTLAFILTMNHLYEKRLYQ